MSKAHEKLAAIRAATQAANNQEEKNEPDYSEFADLIPEADETDPEIEKANQTIDNLIASVGIVGAYKHFIKKMNPRVRAGQTESIMVSCPLPWHPDKNPSAWLNSEKNVWHCIACDRGGDFYDLAAIGLGFDIDSYKKDSFPELRKAIAESFGYEVFSAPGAEETIYVPETESPPKKVDQPKKPVTPKVKEEPEDSPEVLDLEEKIKKKIESSDVFTINWREIVKEDSFIWKYMEATTADTNVEEFHFWNALLALGLAAGRNVYANDNPVIYGNLFICLLGGSGSGKSKSRRYLDDLLLKVLPYKEEDEYPMGTKEIPTANSAEFLIKCFSHPVHIPDEAGKLAIKEYAPVRGLIRFEELSTYKNIAGRQGNDLGGRILEFYDCKRSITTGSMGSGSTIAMQPFASAFTTTQPRSMAKILTEADEDSGFLNRWIFAGGRTKKNSFWGGTRINLSEAEKELMKIHIWASSEKIVGISPEALAKGNEDLNGFITKDKDKYDPSLGRIDLTMKKIMLLFAINEMTTEITIDIYDRAMKLYDYIKGYSLLKTESMTGKTQASEMETLIMDRSVEHYAKTGQWPTAREISRMRGIYRKINGSTELSKMLEGLEKIGLIKVRDESKIEDGKRIGRPTRRYEILS